MPLPILLFFIFLLLTVFLNVRLLLLLLLLTIFVDGCVLRRWNVSVWLFIVFQFENVTSMAVLFGLRFPHVFPPPSLMNNCSIDRQYFFFTVVLALYSSLGWGGSGACVCASFSRLALDARTSEDANWILSAIWRQFLSLSDGQHRTPDDRDTMADRAVTADHCVSKPGVVSKVRKCRWLNWGRGRNFHRFH